MAIMQIFQQSEFFTSIDLKEYRPGQFCWIVVPYITPVPQILDIERRNPEEHSDVKFILRNANRKEDFCASDRTLPIKYLNLRSNEELLIQRCKKRPGIILSSRMDAFPDIAKLLTQKGKKHLQEEEALLVIPCYGIETHDDPTGFPPEMVSRIRCLLYRQFFYFPGSAQFKEGIARLDRIQTVVKRDPSAIITTDVCLAEDLFNLFLALFLFCITGIEDENLSAIRSLTREAYPSS